MAFIIGNTYKDKNNNKYTLLKIQNDIGIFKFNCAEKKLKIINYCGVEATTQYGQILFVSDCIKPKYDAEIDMIKETKKYKLNNNNERYINVFKQHYVK